METPKKISKKGLIILATLTTILSTYLWLDYSYNIYPFSKIESNKKLILAVVSSSLAILEVLAIIRMRWDKKVIRYVGYIFLIPILPLLITGLLSQTRLLASLTLPLMVLSVLIPISTYSYQQLELFGLGEKFDEKVIPYLNLTTITVVFVYADKFLVKILARFIPEDQMPKAVKDATFELLDKRPFVKIAYVFLTALLIVATIEELSGKEFILVLGPYKDVALQSLVTFAAIDRLISKWKK